MREPCDAVVVSELVAPRPTVGKADGADLVPDTRDASVITSLRPLLSRGPRGLQRLEHDRTCNFELDRFRGETEPFGHSRCALDDLHEVPEVVAETIPFNPDFGVYSGLDEYPGAALIQGVDPASYCRFVAAQPHAIGNITPRITAQLVSIIFDRFFFDRGARARARAPRRTHAAIDTMPASRPFKP